MFGDLTLDDSQTLKTYDLKEDETLIVKKIDDIALLTREFAKQYQQLKKTNRRPNSSVVDKELNEILQLYQNDPYFPLRLQHSNPQLYEAIKNNNRAEARRIIEERHRIRMENEQKRMKLIDQLNSDPYNAEIQKKIEELIYEEQIREQLENVIEYYPESFGVVYMLYIDTEINGTPVKVFVDSGAQSTIMSLKCAEKCNITRFIDKAFKGIAKGVGTSAIVGRIHQVSMKIGKSFFPTSLTVIESSDIDVLLGLDMLKRHQCVIDLKNNVLHIGDEVVEFLHEKDIPKHGIEYLNVDNSKSNTNELNIENSGSINNNNNANSQNKYSEEVIKELMNLGNDRESVIRALDAAEGNAELAASLLLNIN